MNTAFLHVLNGDGTSFPFSKCGIPGTVLVWREILCEGPSGLFEQPEEMKRLRAPYLKKEFGAGPGDYQDKVLDVWHQLPYPTEGLEVILWFEHDLFCQINLVYLAQLLFRRGFQSISVVSPESHPEVPGFRGMGQLLPHHFPELFENRKTLNAAALELAIQVWEAWISPAPQQLKDLQLGHAKGWPHLEAALQLHFQLFPSVKTGLNQVETWLMEEIRFSPRTQGQLFQSFCRSWDRLGWGDLQFFNALNRLKGLIEVTAEGYSLSTTGLKVLQGDLNRFSELPTPLRIGNVVCTAGFPGWRWDADHKTLVFIPSH